MTRLCLLRHGQTDWNIEGRYQGQRGVSINATGRAQVQAISQILKQHPFAAFYSSDLARTRETAEIIGEVIPLPVQFDARLREINQGEWEGQLSSVIQTSYADLWQARLADPAHVRAPGGETVVEVAARVYAALDDIARKHAQGPVLIISHGLAIATALCKLQGAPIDRAHQFTPENAQPVWVDWRPS